LEHIKTFWFRSDNLLRYRNVCTSVLVSLTLLVIAPFQVVNDFFSAQEVYRCAVCNCAIAKGAKVLVPLLTIELQRVIAILLIIPTAQHTTYSVISNSA
jgi:hypothetical protein